jgi:hypothetical protein
MFGSRKNPKPEKCLKMPQTPTRPLHALLGALTESKTRSLKKDATAVQIIQPIDEKYALQLVIKTFPSHPQFVARIIS